MSEKKNKKPFVDPIATVSNIQKNWMEWILFLSVAIVLALIPLVYDTSVNRVFDIGKALYLKLPIAVIAFLWAFYRLTERHETKSYERSGTFALPLLLLGLSSIVATILSIDPWMSAVGVYERQFGLHGLLTCISAYFILTTTMKNKTDSNILLFFVLLSSAIVGGYAILQWSNHDPLGWFDEPYGKVYSFLGNANFAGNLLALVCPLSLFIGYTTEKPFIRNSAFISASIILLGVAFAQTRGAWAGTLFGIFTGVVLLSFLSKDQANYRKTHIIIGLFALISLLFVIITFGIVQYHKPVILGFAIFLFILLGWVWKKYSSWLKFSLSNTISIFAIAAFVSFGVSWFLYQSVSPNVKMVKLFYSIFEFEKSTRYHLWTDSFEVIKRHPFFGSGPETYRREFMPYKSMMLETLDQNTNHDNPHNNYLYLWATTGIFGLMAHLWIMVRFFKRGFFILLHEMAKKEDKMMAIAFLSTMAAYAVWTLPGFDSIGTISILIAILASFSVWYYHCCQYLAKSNQTQNSDTQKPEMSSTFEQKLFVHRQPIIIVLLVLLLPASGFSAKVIWDIYTAEQLFAKGLRFKMRRNNTNALYYFEQARKFNPNESYYALNQAMALQSQAREYDDYQTKEHLIKKAEQYLEEGMQHPWAPENIYITRLQGRVQLNDVAGAIESAEKALYYSPHLAPVRTNLGMLYLQLQNEEGNKNARKNFEWAISVNYKNAMARRYLAQMYYQKKEYNNAMYHVQTALKYEPRNQQAKKLLENIKSSLLEQKAADKTHQNIESSKQ